MTPREPGQPDGASIHASITQTDSAGRYRLENVPPGRYYITAGLIDAPTYYPGVSAFSAATVVVVEGRATKEGVDFQLKIPVGMKVSGRMVILPTPRATPATVALIGGTTFSAQETNVNPDGTFQFEKVLPGAYTLQNFVGLPPVPVVVSDNVTGLEIGRGAVGVRVSGRVVSPDSPAGTFSSQNVILNGVANPFSAPGAAIVGTGVITSATSAGTSFQVRPDSTGAFEFLRVPPGNYTLRVLPTAGGTIQTTSLIVADQEISNLELRIPFQSELSGRVVLEDGRPWTPPVGSGIELRRANGTMGTSIQAGGAFRFILAEGDYQIGLRGLPLGYVLKSVSVGDTPLSGSLKIAPGSPAPTNVVVTLASIPLESIQGVKVSGRITGVPAGSLGGASIILQGADSGMNTVETIPNADGTFEFPRVPQGNYNMRVNGIANANVSPGLTRFFIGTDNMTGIQIPVEVRTSVTGRVTVVDSNGAAITAFPTGIGVSFRRGTGSLGTGVRPDGTFTAPLTEGEHTISFDRLPPGYTVKSIMAGGTDLLKNPLRIERGVQPPLIEVKMEAKP
jgi:hypothetical protein